MWHGEQLALPVLVPGLAPGLVLVPGLAPGHTPPEQQQSPVTAQGKETLFFSCS